MENQQTLPKQFILNYGVILGVLAIIISLLSYTLNGLTMERPFWEKALGWMIIIALIFYGVIKFKEANNGLLKFGQAVKIGVGIALIGGLITALYIFIFFNYIEPTALDQISIMVEEQMMEQNPEMPEEQMEMALSMTKKFMTPTAMSFIAILGNLFIGLIISLIAGAIMKKNEDEIYS